MANKTFMKMARRGVKNSLSRFVSIVSIVALGVGFLAGLLATTPDMKNSANDYFEKNNFYDFYIQSTLGFSEDDIKALDKLEYVNHIEAIKQEDIIVKDSEEESLETRIFYVDFQDENRLNKFELLEGRLPEKDGECIIEIPNQYSYNTEIGSIFETEDGKKYKAVGIARSPMFLSTRGENTQIGKGSVALGMYLEEEKDTDVYTAVYGVANIDSRNTFTKGYEKEIEKITGKLDDFGKVQVKKRYETIKKEAQDELDINRNKFEKEKRDAFLKLEESKNMLLSNQLALDDGKKQIIDGIDKIDDGIVQIKKEQEKLKGTLKDINAKEDKITTGKSQLLGYIKQVDAGIAQIENTIDGLPYVPEQLKSQLAELKSEKKNLEKQYRNILVQEKQLKSGKEKAIKGQETLNEKLRELENQRDSLIRQKESLKDNQQQIDNGWNEYYDGQSKAMAEFEEAKRKLDDAQKEIDTIENGKWYTFTRLDSNGVSGFKGDVDKVAAIAKIFPVFFFLVAALVVLTTVTRMIEEERMQVGTLKSLGYTNSIIRNYYLGYGFVATILGSVLGLSVGFVLFPKVISNAYGMMYNVPPVKTEFIWELAIGIVLVTIICIMSTIFIACKNELKENAATLMQPKAPVAGKRIFLERITPLWSRLKFTRKVTLRNLFRYKKRFMMTIIGVAGCFALLVTGFGVRDSIGDIVHIQFGEVFKYDMTVSVDQKEWKEDKKIFKEESFFGEESITVTSKENEETATLDVPYDNSKFTSFVDLRTRAGHKGIKLTDDGVVLSEKMCEVLQVEVGDKVTMENSQGDKGEAEIIGICENYVYNRAFMTEQLYKDVFKSEPKYNMLFGKLADNIEDSDKAVSKIMKKDGVQYAMATDTIRKNFSDSVKNIDYIVMVLIFSAGALSVIVLYNLTNINICERKKELATIKVLGFYEKEVSTYIFREINILAFLGILLGLPAGIALHQFVIKTAEVGGMMFGRNIYLLSYGLSVIITVGFTLLVNIIMRRSIRKIDMVESMKAND